MEVVYARELKKDTGSWFREHQIAATVTVECEGQKVNVTLT